MNGILSPEELIADLQTYVTAAPSKTPPDSPAAPERAADQGAAPVVGQKSVS